MKDRFLEILGLLVTVLFIIALFAGGISQCNKAGTEEVEYTRGTLMPAVRRWQETQTSRVGDATVPMFSAIVCPPRGFASRSANDPWQCQGRLTNSNIELRMVCHISGCSNF